MQTETQTITASKRNDFRTWLKKYHKTEKRVAVVLYKRHTGKPAPTHRELMEEAICFGWIDTTIKRLDEDRYIRNFARRNQNSTWSDNTLGYARQLIKEGKMTAEGLKFYELGRKKPTHDAGIPKNPRLPSALKQALAKSKKAQATFNAWPPSTKKMLYRWLLSAKLPQTRTQRIKRIVDAAKEGKKKFW